MIGLIEEGRLTYRNAAHLFPTLVSEGGDPEALVVSIVVAFLLTAGCVFGVLRPRRWARQPPLPLMLQHVVNAEFEDDELIAWAARQMTTAITNNEVLLGQKSGWLLNAYVECRRSSHIVGIAYCVRGTLKPRYAQIDNVGP